MGADLKDVLAVQLRQARNRAGLTQEELAESAQLSPRYVGSIERGTVSASVTVLGWLAAALGLDAAELIAKRRR